MEVKEFERLLELKEQYNNVVPKDCEDYKDRESIYEYWDLKKKLENFLFDNQSNTERIITKLKNSLSERKCNFKYNPSETLNEVKVIREIMELLNRYDWQQKYSEYNTSEGKQIAIWEQNGDGQIRNHKVWNIIPDIKEHYRTVSIHSSGFSEDTINDIANKVMEKISSEMSKSGIHNHM